MGKLIGSWSFYKKTLMIAIPVMIQNLITNFVALIDNIMVGQVGTEQMSGVAIVNQLFFVYNLNIFYLLLHIFSYHQRKITDFDNIFFILSMKKTE